MCPCFQISGITPGSLAESDARLQVGDWLLSINGESTIGAKNREATRMLEQPRENITLGKLSYAYHGWLTLLWD